MKLNYEPIATSEIDKEIAKLEKEAKNIPCTALLIMPNNVIEVKDNVIVVAGDVRRIEKYKANINKVFSEIANKQMEDFYKLVTQLPEDRSEWNKYLQILEKDKGYSPTKAIKEVAEINELVKKFEQSPNKKYHDNYRLVEENTNKLLEYIDHLPEEAELIGRELPTYTIMSCM
ncbi:MAG TPA: hypothetical protein LFW21_04790 [Rickettsia endosymbiont of Pyrocoelia pectoralis]|nr:hypothetical protein [Rickettsia endosymbiont of Pyrocoelia pectoralis]